jgi:hypothetical protein
MGWYGYRGKAHSEFGVIGLGVNEVSVTLWPHFRHVGFASFGTKEINSAKRA